MNMLKTNLFRLATPLLIAWLVLGAAFPQVGMASNILKIRDVSATVGDQVTIEIEIDNTDSFTSFQFDIPLPDGFGYVAASVNVYRRTDHIISASILPNTNTLRILSYSGSNAAFTSADDKKVATFNLSTPLVAGEYTLTPGNYLAGSGSGNILTGIVAGSVTLAKKTPNVTWPAGSGIIVGQSLSSSSLSGGSASYGASSVAGSFAYSNPSEQPGLGTASVEVTFTPSDGDQYATVAGNINITVGKKPLTLTATSVTKNYGEEVTLSGYSVAGLNEGDAVTAVTLSSEGISTWAAAGEYAITISNAQGTGLDNYDISYVNGTLTVSKINLTVTGATAENKVYDGNTSATLTGAVLNGVVTGDNNVVLGALTGEFGQAEAGDNIAVTASISLSGSSAANYTLTQPTGLTANITKRPLTIAADDKTKVADGNPFTNFTATYTGFASGQGSANLTGSITFGGTAVGATEPGTYTITPGGYSSGNYEITYQNGTLTIAQLKLDQTITFGPLETKIFGDAPFDLTATASSNLPVTYSSSNPAVATISGNRVTIIAVGQTVITASQAGNELFNAAPDVEQPLTVNEKSITITATSVSKSYGSEISLSAYTVSGLEAGDEVTSVTLSSSGTGAMVAPGSYPIEVSNAQGTGLDKYVIIYAAGTLTVNPKLLTIEGVSANSKSYDGTDLASLNYGQLNGILTNQTVWVDNPAGRFAQTTPGNNIPVYGEITIAGPDAGNYQLEQPSGMEASISPREIWVYADTLVAECQEIPLTYTFEPALIGSDSFSGALTRAPGTNLGTYAISRGTLSLNSNYSLNFTGATYTIQDSAPFWVTEAGSLDRTVLAGDADALAAAQLLAPIAGDLCDTTAPVPVKTAGELVKTSECFEGGIISNTWIATDSRGSVSVAFVQVITISDPEFVNPLPTMDQPANLTAKQNAGTLTMVLTGIESGHNCEDHQVIEITAGSSNPALTVAITVDYERADSTALLTIELAENAWGTSIISISVKNSGGTANNGTDTAVYSFTLTVEEDTDPPVLKQQIPHLVIQPGEAFEIDLSQYFGKGNEEDILTYLLELLNGDPLPEWVSIDSETGLISGILPADWNGSITFIVKVSDQGGLYIETSFAVAASVPETRSISGIINQHASGNYEGIEVLLYWQDPGTTEIVGRYTLTNASGFHFTGLEPGTYLLRAIVTDDAKQPAILSTYYPNVASVHEAAIVNLLQESVGSITISMLEKPVIGSGSLEISGRVLISGLNGEKSASASANNDDVQPAPFVDVVLKLNGVIIATTMTDANGNYSFTNLPQGQYIVEVQLPGYEQVIVAEVILDEETVVEEDINFTIWATNGTITSVPLQTGLAEIQVYPNPTRGNLNIELPRYESSVISVYDLTGRRIMVNQFGYNSRHTLDLSRQSPGIYLVHIQTESNYQIKKVVVDPR